MKNLSTKNDNRPTLGFNKISVDTMEVLPAGNWNIDTATPSADQVFDHVKSVGDIKRVRFNSDKLMAWDSSLLTFILEVHKRCSDGHLQVENDGLPNGVRRLLQLAVAVPKKGDARQSVIKESFLSKVGSDAIGFVKSAGDLVSFIGDASVALVRLLTGRAQFRLVDLFEFLQDTGARAVPIVSLISKKEKNASC